MTFYYKRLPSNRHNKWWVNIKRSFKITHALNLRLQKIKLCSFTNLSSQKFSDTAVTLALKTCH